MKLLVIAKPGARRERIEKVDEKTFRVSVKAPPEKGRANEAILKLLAKYFGISNSQIRLLSGASSKYKHISF